eukprot:4835291-Prymnesium_polylepis.2
MDGKPVWRHAAGHDVCIACAQGIWYVQPEQELGRRQGYMATCEATLLLTGFAVWRCGAGGTWHQEPSLRCVESRLPRAPRVISLDGVGLTGRAAARLGYYKLVPHLATNGRPMWRHASGQDAYVAFDKVNKYWNVQTEKTLGTTSGVMHSCSTTFYPPDCRSWRWLGTSGSTGWQDEPSLKSKVRRGRASASSTDALA